MRIFLLFFFLLSSLLSEAKSDDIETYGDVIQIAIPLSAYIATHVLDDEEGNDQFWKSFLSTSSVTHILKATVKEKRPNKSNDKSFPSGHTSASFHGASFIHKRYGIKHAIIPYVGATFVGYSRVHSDNHFTRDVVAGALIGVGFSFYFTTPYRYKKIEVKPTIFNSKNSQNVLYGLIASW